MLKKICKMRNFCFLAVILTVIICVYCAVGVRFSNLKINNNTPTEFENWKIFFEDGSFKKCTLPANISASKNEKIVLNNSITEEIAGQTIAFCSKNTNIVVRVDGKNIYEYKQDSEKSFVKTPAMSWHFIHVPEEFEVGSLDVELTSPYKDLGGKVEKIVWGARSACILSFVYSECFHVFVGFAFLILGIVLSSFYYVLGHLKMQNSGLLYLSFSAILLAIHVMIISGILQIFYGNTIVLYLVCYTSLFLCFVFFTIFLERTILKSFESVFEWVSKILLLFYFVVLGLQFAGIVDLLYFSTVFWIAMILFLLFGVAVVINDGIKKKLSVIKVWFSIISGIEIVLICLDIFNDKIESVGLRHYGLIVLYIVLACNYIYSAVHNYRNKMEEKMQLNVSTMQSLMESQTKLSKEIENLTQTKETAEDMNNMKSVFLGNVAEKLLMPMNRIIGLNELILRDDITDTTSELAGNIQSEASVMLTLINNIMDYSKVENGELQLKPVAYHVQQLLYDMCEIVSLGIIDKKIDFIVDFSPNIPIDLLGDEIRIRQILSNILNNAILYTNEGVIRFRIESELTAADEVLLTITISDTGIGMEENQLNSLFENFLMSDANTLAEHKGTGLGLAVCKQLIQLMSGSIDVKSTKGEGSVFTIVLPQKIINGMPLVETKKTEYKVLIYETNQLQRMVLKKTCMDIEVDADFVSDDNDFKASIASNVYRTVIICEDMYLRYKEYLDSDVCAGIRTVVLVDVEGTVNIYENAELLQRPVQCMNLYDAISGNDIVKPIAANYTQEFIAPQANILIVDDNPSNLKICMAMLEPFKVQITTCLSGKEAIEIMKEQPSFDIVLLDYSMPNMSGPEITSEIRGFEDKYYKTLPIIAMSAKNSNGAKELFVSEGFDDFITKPFDEANLEKILETYIKEDKLLYSDVSKRVNV